MSEEEKKQNNSNNSDEIDLRQLFSSIGDFFKSIFVGFIMLIVAFKNATIKYFKIIFLFVVLGGLIGIALKYVLPDYYTSSMLLRSSYSTVKLTESSIEKLDQLCQEGNYEGLATKLNIDTAVAKNIKGFSYEPFVSEAEIVELEILKEQLKSEIENEEVIERFVEKLKNENKSTYRIFVQVYDSKNLGSLEEPLIDYFRNSQYISKRLQIEKENLILKERNIDEELQKLDSLRELVIKNYDNLAERNRTGSNNIIMKDEQLIDPLSIINKRDQLYQEKLRIQQQLYLTPSFELIDGFTVFSKPDSPGLLKIGFYSCLYGLLIAYVIIMLIYFNKYLNSVEELEKKKSELG
ncbi:hypothetical protein JKA74_12820 [Marivirga sp. S37H4]|uniref:Uncharacterized protein n=1 Tax=Marivirga aurantiaca TaxID=2802615 RepID=A0A935CCB7_9BACT|nr:hypothetical protein [Marivirga aurantiaca]MBK6265918.1 hypothetical protein [Marivirga aurantiaca]